MSILQYLKPINGTPDPNGQLSSIVSSAAIQRMNQEVRVASESSNSLPTNMKFVMEDVQLSSYAYSIAIFEIVQLSGSYWSISPTTVLHITQQM